MDVVAYIFQMKNIDICARNTYTLRKCNLKIHCLSTFFLEVLSINSNVPKDKSIKNNILGTEEICSQVFRT